MNDAMNDVPNEATSDAAGTVQACLDGLLPFLGVVRGYAEEGRVTFWRGDIRELFQRHQSSSRIGQALALLLKHGRARVAQEQSGGRPAERWRAVGAGEEKQEEAAR